MNKRKKTNDTQQEPFGLRLARIRQEAGYSQRALAKEAEITKRMIACYETQGGNPPIYVLFKLADILGITTDELLGRAQTNGNNLKPQNRRLRKKLSELEKLPQKNREIVIKVIDSFLDKQKV